MYGRSDNRQRHLLQDIGHGQRRASLCADFQRIAARATVRFVCLAKAEAKAKPVRLLKVRGAQLSPSLSLSGVVHSSHINEQLGLDRAAPAPK